MHIKTAIQRTLVLMLMTVAAFGQAGTPAIDPFETMMTDLMAKYPNVIGSQIALTVNGRLVMARGYGYSDEGKTILTEPNSRFRIASLSKLITAVAIMHLVDLGKLSVDQPAFALLPDLQAPGGQDKDPRLATITIRNLLNHAGGWDVSKSNFDPMFESAVISADLNVSAPASTENTIRYMRGQMLDFTPGMHYAYSNFGYAVLGRIVEHVTGMGYEQYVRLNVLAPMGITDMRIGQALPQGKLAGEVYYVPAGKQTSVYPDVNPQFVPSTYGSWYVEGQDSHGGWICSTIDYVKFMNGIEGRRGKAFLSAASIAAMTARPSIPDWAHTDTWYGFGIEVNPTANGQIWTHNGSLDGTTTQEIRTDNGMDWVVFLNWRPRTDGGIGNMDNDIYSALFNAAAQVSNWPAADYFANFPNATPAQAPALNTREGVANGATFDRGVVSGSWISLFGVNLASTTRNWTRADFNGNQLPTSLDGVSVLIDGKLAAVSYISPTQINAQAPEGLKASWVTASVINNGVSSGLVLTHAMENAPGAMTYSVDGVKFASAKDAQGNTLGPKAPAREALPGDQISILATGLAPSPAGSKIDTPVKVNGVTVTIGGQSAELKSVELISPGLFQIDVVVPAVAGGNQPVVISIKSQNSPPDVFVPIAAH